MRFAHGRRGIGPALRLEPLEGRTLLSRAGMHAPRVAPAAHVADPAEANAPDAAKVGVGRHRRGDAEVDDGPGRASAGGPDRELRDGPAAVVGGAATGAARHGRIR